MATGVGTATTVNFDTSYFAEIIGTVEGPSYDRGFVQTSHMTTTTAHSYIPVDLYDPGTIEVEMHFEGTTGLPTFGAEETVLIDYAGAGTTTRTQVQAFMTNFTPSAPFEDVMTATATLKISGAPIKSAS